MRRLIINADDCNLTRGVTEAIFECHDRGVVTSTTFLINLPVEAQTLRGILKRKKLGVGIHLNVTLAGPVSAARKVRSLLRPDGRFRPCAEQTSRPPKPNELFCECQSQIDRFHKVFGRRPTHLDTHHQVHDLPVFFRVIAELARRNRLPTRRSRCLLIRDISKTEPGTFGRVPPEAFRRTCSGGNAPVTTDYFFG